MKFLASVLASAAFAQDQDQPLVCGPRLRMEGATGNLAQLNGQWKFAMSDSGNVMTNADYPYYKLEGSNKYMWWMWHGPTGHWVVNETPGQHGGDLVKSTFADFACPQDLVDWEISTSTFTNGKDGDFNIEANPCCQHIKFDSEFGSFSQNGNFNAEYPVYQSDDGDMTLWWMWHGGVGHWVMNNTPGQHQQPDVIKSAFDDAKCPDQVAQWEGRDETVSCWSGPPPPPIEYSKEFCSLDENKVDFVFQRNKNAILRKGGNSYVMRVRSPRISETKDYTGLLAFGRKDCGQKFLDALMNGDVLVDVADQVASYEIKYKFMGQTGSNTNVVFQFDVNHEACGDKKCLGNAKQDQFELIVMGLDNVNFGKKDPDVCLRSVKTGFLGIQGPLWKDFRVDVNDDDVTPCISWVNMYWDNYVIPTKKPATSA